MKNNRIITICGSTKFKKDWERAIKFLISERWFVHSVEVYGHAEGLNLRPEYKKWLEELHLWKIERSDAIYVVDIGGYIGESTRREIEEAKKRGLTIIYDSKMSWKKEQEVEIETFIDELYYDNRGNGSFTEWVDLSLKCLSDLLIEDFFNKPDAYNILSSRRPQVKVSHGEGYFLMEIIKDGDT